jgi:hypothetical protein
MLVLRRWIVSAAVVLVGSSVWSLAAGAQAAARTGAPVKGTWGGEAAVGDGQSASLLLFQSARWALLAGGSIRTVSSASNLVGQNRFTTTALRVGARRYGGTGLGLRPVVGLGAVVVGFTGQRTEFGGYGELGAVYFFNPHVSLGAVSEATVAGRSGGGSSIGVSLARLIGTVYF